jgi:hypothetical protein
MLALPKFDIEGRQIYNFDILECNYSDYYDRSGIDYPRDRMIRIIADPCSTDIPNDVKIVSNKFENPKMYRQTLWDNDLKTR